LTSLLPSVNEKAAKINATYKKPNVHTVATLDVFKVKRKKGKFKEKEPNARGRPTLVLTLSLVKTVSLLVLK
jgi:hypothetical protein